MNYDSDSSVDRVSIEGRLFRLKCDCCKAKRAETEFDFHPCQVEKCTFAICWSCLQRWKDQSDKDVTKRFECPQCHTEYNTKLIEQHKPLTSDMIQKINQKTKLLRRKKKKLKKKRQQEQANKKSQLTDRQKMLKQRLDQDIRNKTNKHKKKKDKNNEKNNNSNNSNKSTKNNGHHNNNNNNKQICVLNKNRIIVEIDSNSSHYWTEKMVNDIFGKIGPIAKWSKPTDAYLSITFRKSQSDKARRVLLYLFDLQILIAHDTINSNSKSNIQSCDIFNPNVAGGKREFLMHRDRTSNWNEYSIPSFDCTPPGCHRWISGSVQKLSKDQFLREMQNRPKLRQKQQQRLLYQTKKNNLNLNQNQNQNRNTLTRPLSMPDANIPVINHHHHNNNYSAASSSASSLLPTSHPFVTAASSSFSMNDIKPPQPIQASASLSALHNNNRMVRNGHTHSHAHAQNGYTNNATSPPYWMQSSSSSMNLNHHRSHHSTNYNDRYSLPSSPSTTNNSNFDLYSRTNNNMPPGPPPGIPRSFSSQSFKSTNDDDHNNMLFPNGTQKSKMAKISNILNKKKEITNSPTLTTTTTIPPQQQQQRNGGLKWQKKPTSPPMIKPDENNLGQLINWICNNKLRAIKIVSDEDELSDCDYTTDNILDAHHNLVKPQQSTTTTNNNHNERGDDGYDNEYNYSSEEEIVSNTTEQHQQLQQQRQIHLTNLSHNNAQLPIEDMTIQQMLDNLDHFAGDEVDAILAKLLPAKQEQEQQQIQNHIRRRPPPPAQPPQQQQHDQLQYDYDYDDDDEEEGGEEEEDINNTDLHVIRQSMQNQHQQRNINNISLSMERHRNEIEIIAKNVQSFNLAKLPDFYYEFFHRNIKSVFNGKLKELVTYFDDIFIVHHNASNNSTFIVSKIFDVNAKCDEIELNGNGNGMATGTGGVSLIRSVKKRFTTMSVNSNADKNIYDKHNKLRWTPKKKESENENENEDEEETNFNYGPSYMYTQPRVVPQAHAHLIGNNGGTAMMSYNKYGSTNARPYRSARKGNRNRNKLKAKNYGDFADEELPCTPSGSDASDE